MKETTWKLVGSRREKKGEINDAKTRLQKKNKLEEYNEMDRQVKRSCREDKRRWVNELAAEAEEAAVKHNTKRMYELTRIISGKHRNLQSKPVKDRNGTLLTRKEEQLKRWREHFQSILNRPAPENPPDITGGTQLNIRTGNITKAEIKKALKSLNKGKAAGCDDIPPEAWKSGGVVSEKILYSLLNKIWEKEVIPEDWKKGILIKLPKKGDLTECKNWRGIMLLSIASKVLCRIILERIKDALDKELRDEQAGFRRERSCCDQIATLRIIVEQSYVWNTQLYLVFVDFEKAFDSIDRNVLWKLLQGYGLPVKIINMIRLFYEGFQASVLHDGDLTDSFGMGTGVRQGCLLSPLLFLVALDWVTRKAFDGGTGIQWTLSEKLEDLDFADDLVLMSQKISDMRKKVEKLEDYAKKVGLKINSGKTKEMRIRPKGNVGDVQCNGEPLECVEKFTYLGSEVTPTGGTEEDIASRCRKAQGAFTILRPLWRSKQISMNTKIRIFNSNVKTVLLYGCETWRTNQKSIGKLQSFINRRLRYIMGIWWPRKISNKELWERTRQEPVYSTIKRRCWKWIGHTLRKSQDNTTRRALKWNPQGYRKRGRPAATWQKTINEDLEKVGVSWGEAAVLAQNRVRWRSTVEALCSRRGEED